MRVGSRVAPKPETQYWCNGTGEITGLYSDGSVRVRAGRTFDQVYETFAGFADAWYILA